MDPQLLSRLFAQAPVPLAIWNVAGQVSFTNAAFAAMFRADLPPQHNALEDPCPALGDMAALFRRALAGETVDVPIVWLRRAAPLPRIAISATIFPIAGDGQEIAHVAAIYRDETEGEARKAALMEAALDATVMMDHEGRITAFNAAAEKTFGYSRDEVIGKPLADMIVPESLRSQHVAGLRNYLATGEQRVIGRRLELPAMRKDGVEFPAEVAIVRVPSEGPPAFTGYIRDITERRRAAEAEMLRREKDAAEAANAELEAFSYSVAHDLRTPLRGISGFSAALLEDHGHRFDEDAHRQLERIISAGKRMGQIIDALLDLARFTRAALQRETVDLAALAQSIFDQLRASEPGRAVELVIPPHLIVRADVQLARVMLENLLSNSWKFTRNQPRARIEVGSTLVDDRRAYFVRDNGAGFNMEYAAKLFIPFQRLHAAEQFEGTGIGLATVQRIVRRHGGSVWAQSAENAGATFYFTFQQERFRRHTR